MVAMRTLALLVPNVDHGAAMTRHDPGIDDPTTTLVCCHGQLARSCDLCSLEAEIEEHYDLVTREEYLAVRAELVDLVALLRRARNGLRTREYLCTEEIQLAAEIDSVLVVAGHARYPCTHAAPCWCSELIREP